MNLLRWIMYLFLILMTSLQAGEYADAFLLKSLYPQVQSLGHSTVAFPVQDGHALNNPAGFVHGSSSQVSLVYEQFGGLSSNFGFEAKVPIGEKYDLGFTLIHNSIDNLIYRPNLFGLAPVIRRDSVLTLALSEGESIRYREDAAILSVAREYEFEINLGWKLFKIPCRMPVGLSVKYLDKLLVENRGLGSGIDLGSQLFFSLAELSDWLRSTSFAVGVFWSDILNTPVYWNTQHQDAIKRNLTIGYSITQRLEKYSTELSFSAGTQDRYPNVHQYGLEVRVKDLIFLRGGHDGYNPSFGLGIALKKFIIGYTFSQHELADMQKIGINYHF